MITQPLPEWLTLTNLSAFRDGKEVRIWRCSVELDGLEDFVSRTGDTEDAAIYATMSALHDVAADARRRIEQMALLIRSNEE